MSNLSLDDIHDQIVPLLEKPYVFLIGSPRSGSTWLHSLMNKHPEIASTKGTELTYFNDYLSPLIDKWNREKNKIDEKQWKMGLPYIWTDEEFFQFQQLFTALVYTAIDKTKPEAKCIIDRFAGYSSQVELIRSILPNAKFLHLLRDGREVVVSSMSTYKRKGFGNNGIFPASYSWLKFVNNALKVKEQVDKDYLEIRYEALLGNPNEIMKTVFDFCGTRSEDEIVELVCSEKLKEKTSFPNPKRKNYKQALWESELSFWQKFVFDKIAKKKLIELGYESTKYSVLQNVLSLIYTPIYYSVHLIRYVLKPALKQSLRKLGL